MSRHAGRRGLLFRGRIGRGRRILGSGRFCSLVFRGYPRVTPGSFNNFEHVGTTGSSGCGGLLRRTGRVLNCGFCGGR